MKPTPTHLPEKPVLMAFGAHPDDIEFGCGGLIARETRAGCPAHLIVCSRGESASYGTPPQRIAETESAAALLGAGLEFVELDGDAHLEIRASHAIQLARVIRRSRPTIVLAPTLEENQHPDHHRLGRLVRDAARLARYGGLKELADLPAHAISQLFFYAISPEAEPVGLVPVLVDISAPEIMAAWTAAMEAHASQVRVRKYVELQLTRARLHGLRAGIDYAMALYPNDALVVSSLAQLSRGARIF